MTVNQMKRVQADFQNICKEVLAIECIDNVIYAFGSELATLRLLKQYRNVPKARAEYSENTKSHYFVLELTTKSIENLKTSAS